MSADNPTNPPTDRNPPEFWLWLQEHGWAFTVERAEGMDWAARIETPANEFFGGGKTPLQALVSVWQDSQRPMPAPKLHPVACPDCGPVEVRAVAWDGARAVAGKCPKCRETLYFA